MTTNVETGSGTLHRPPYRPIGDRLLIRPDKVPGVTRGGIILPDSVRAELQKKADRGTVLAMGPGMLRADGRRWPMPDVAIGARVLYMAEGAQVVEIGGEKLLSVRDDFIFAEEIP